MTFGQSYLTHLKCLEDVGMTSIEPIEFQGQQIVPLQFLKAVLPDPSSLGPPHQGKDQHRLYLPGQKRTARTKPITCIMCVTIRSATRR